MDQGDQRPAEGTEGPQPILGPRAGHAAASSQIRRQLREVEAHHQRLARRRPEAHRGPWPARLQETRRCLRCSDFGGGDRPQREPAGPRGDPRGRDRRCERHRAGAPAIFVAVGLRRHRPARDDRGWGRHVPEHAALGEDDPQPAVHVLRRPPRGLQGRQERRGVGELVQGLIGREGSHRLLGHRAQPESLVPRRLRRPFRCRRRDDRARRQSGHRRGQPELLRLRRDVAESVGDGGRNECRRGGQAFEVRHRQPLSLIRAGPGETVQISLYAERPLSRSVKIASVVGARPQFIKAAPVSREIRQHNEEILVHTGQHYDENMSDVFFEVLDMPRPDYNLGVGSASHARQTAEMMRGLEDVFEREKPDLVLVYGDTSSTLAGALVAAKMGRPLGHVEAGLRAFNRSLPEEINRVVADHLASLLFCPTQTAVDNLAKEGINRGVHLVGDVMYDVALQSAQAAPPRDTLTRIGVRKGEYVLVTLHRPSNVDDRDVLAGIVHGLARSNRTVVFPVHPRTRKNLEAFGLWEELWAKVKAIEPVDYLDFIALLMGAAKVVTDSGGVQKEAYFFGVPCITLRDETEWIETVEDGWNALVGSEPEDILDALEKFNPAGTKSKSFGDGHAAEKIARILDRFV